MALFRQQKLGEVTKWLRIWYVKYLWSSAWSVLLKALIYDTAVKMRSWYANDVFQSCV